LFFNSVIKSVRIYSPEEHALKLMEHWEKSTKLIIV
jgi:hypothetical protein